MTPDQQARLDACLEEAASILYADTTAEMQTLEDIERVVRGHLLEKVGPEIGFYPHGYANAGRTNSHA